MNQSATPTVLIVDDMPENLAVLGELLQPHCRVRVASSGERALQVARSSPQPDLILLDVMMPGMDGYQVLKQLRVDPATREIPVIFVTALGESEDEELGLSLGAVDYIPKPIRPAIVLARVKSHLELKRARDRLKDENRWLEDEVQRRMRDNRTIQDVGMRALASLAETRDNETGNHIRRTQGYVELLARHLRADPAFAGQLTDENIELIVKAAPLHDIGKVGIPDHILLKPAKFEPEEWEIMKTHSRLGSDAIEHAMQGIADHAPLLFMHVAMDIAHYHHEKWDGSGYPEGLAGAAIPLPARLMALADVFDALISRRVYKEPMPSDKATAIVLQGKGSHFDPAVADAFVARHAEFLAIAQRYADSKDEVDAKARLPIETDR